MKIDVAHFKNTYGFGANFNTGNPPKNARLVWKNIADAKSAKVAASWQLCMSEPYIPEQQFLRVSLSHSL